VFRSVNQCAWTFMVTVRTGGKWCQVWKVEISQTAVLRPSFSGSAACLIVTPSVEHRLFGVPRRFFGGPSVSTFQIWYQSGTSALLGLVP